ncbi:MAG: hypothetical protein R6W76_01015 [Caldilinea sp.]
MVRGRFILAGIVVLVVLALIFGAIANGQRDAWTQGYLVGRLTAVEGEGALASAGLLPYAAYGYPPRGPGFGSVLFLLLRLGAVFFIGSRFVRMAQWRAWAAQQGSTPEGQPNAPWGGPPMGWGCGGGHRRNAEQAPAPAAETPPQFDAASER